MWAISIICISYVCLPMPVSNVIYSNEKACEENLIRIAKAWKPNQGGYVFNCVDINKGMRLYKE